MKTRINVITLSKSIIYFINFFGFSAIIALMMAMGFSDDSRYYTIPLRLLEVLFIFLLFVLKKYKPCNNKMIYVLFVWFFSVYFFKISLEIVKGTDNLHIPLIEFFLYSIIYAIIPFAFFVQKKDDEEYELIFNAIYFSGIVFSVLSLYLYTKTIFVEGEFSRYTSTFDPLIYSYTGAMLIGVCLMKLLFDDYDNKRKRRYIAGVLIGIIPFLIGGSRGPIVALFVPLFFSLFIKQRFRVKYKYLLYSVLGIILILIASTFLGNLSFKRLFNIFNDLATGSTEVIRIEIWRSSFEQFLQSPIWGDSIQRDGGSYPHNLIIEVLMATGIIGFIPYITLIVYAMTRSARILEQNPSEAWIFMLFIVSFFMGMFSGNISSDIWYWSSLALVLSIELKTKKILISNA